ncbi:TetR family transcriptional regulator [Saccharothrix longispora]|uniref:TetR/AcrR family transcriptional regulator n=1 Tax=Saccharothrix longispora TaxID=33920 RepID=UPI0028FD9591|nr:TetR family transcriptional regulator [Saccharothrix longispora]MBY8850757.1 TetR family transcriptional regulator [Saccharothrix sp. MB29]MDU0289224.1 TetR family transcriptional regulator [Saccharothrix longispora]
MVDGRRVRGERRRRALLEAALRVVERDGVAGVGHRSVAREAGVPATSATYYYATLDDLLIATLTWSAEEMASSFRSLPPTPAAFARFLADAVGPHRGRTMAEYELYLLAARRPELRPAARRWLDLVAEAVGPGEPVALRALLAGLDGLLIQGLIADVPPVAREFEPVVSLLMPGRRPPRATLGP